MTILTRFMNKLKPILSRRFLKFCTVGVSGVVVNLGFLWIFADLFRIHTNLASALAIELSVLSNFAINEAWTFRDRRNGNAGWRAVRFNLVSLVGAAMQWSIFVALNLSWFVWLGASDVIAEYIGQVSEGGWLAHVVHAVTQPPEVGEWKYLSQLIGIGAATFWNFLVNFYWTWRAPDVSVHRPST